MNVRFVFRSSIALAACLPLIVAAQTPNITGKWELDPAKSVISGAGESLPRITLEIVHEGTRLSIKERIPGKEEELRESNYTTDGKECLNAGRQLKDLSSTCQIEDGKIVIRGEEEAVTAVYEGAGEPVVDYVKFKSVREYALSADGTILTLSMNFDTPQGPQSMTLVFNRAKAS